MFAITDSPTIYEYYAGGGIAGGLSAGQPFFTLNHRNITLYSGAMHYFRVPKDYWRDRLRKMRAAGLNAVETYVPWNLHEPEPNVFDFGHGGSEMEEFLDLTTFLKTAQEEDLLAIVRPGPYICSEWEFGGFPPWLLREKGIRFRTSESTFMRHVTRYFSVLLPILAALQFTKGGPIIAMQVENEYGSTAQKGKFMPDRLYLEQLRRLFLQHGIVELLFTSDSPSAHGNIGTLPGVFLQTANFASNPEKEFDILKRLQPNKPSMAMEFWTGWFDHWSENHHLRANKEFYDVLEHILKYPASVNMYMFHGGTSWGFLNGANIPGGRTDNSRYQPDTTSYDYDCPLSEAGDYTEKYIMVKELLTKYTPIHFKTPQAPAIKPRIAFPNLNVTKQLRLRKILDQIPESVENSERTLPMELLPINNGSGQKYGYIVYRRKKLSIPKDSILKIAGHVCDTVMVLVNGILVSKPLTGKADLDDFGYWRMNNSKLMLAFDDLQDATLELVVENYGRNNFGYLDQFFQYKGIWEGGVFLNDEELLGWDIIPMEFKKQWTSDLEGWNIVEDPWLPGPALYKTEFATNNPRDVYLDMREWTKGIVMINGFVLGRYATVLGPQQTLYLPAPLLNNGRNEIVIFEHFKAANRIRFSTDPIFYTPSLTEPPSVLQKT